MSLTAFFKAPSAVLSWERVKNEGRRGDAWRARVPGGWVLIIPSESGPEHTLFLPDGGHTWGLTADVSVS
jgi:hypothetical protein